MKNNRLGERIFRSPSGKQTDRAIGRRLLLKRSVLGGSAVLAESLFGPLPDPALTATQDGATAAAAAAPQTPPKSLGEVPPIKLEYVFQIRIDFSERVSFDTPNGHRAYVPAVSGVIEGPRLQGKVVPHSGADYGGNGRLDAHYMLQASDGTMIYINNMGYLYPLDRKPLDRSDPSWGGDREFYFRTTPYFDTPVGPHDWLTRTIIVGTAKRHANPDYTIFTYYAVL